MRDVIYWVAAPGLYAVVVWTVFILLLVLGLAPVLLATPRTAGSATRTVWMRRVQSPIVFLAFVWFFIFAARWPGLFYFTAFNVDEAQILAAAQALVEDPLFFRSAECGSSGPMVVYPLLVSVLFGQDPGYFSARVVGLIMVSGTATAFYGICRWVVSESLARVVTLAPVTLLALTTYWDFVHYTSEHAPVFYLFAGFYFTAVVAFHPELSWRKFLACAIAGAVCFSMVPFAKLQGTYLALFGGLLLVIAVFHRSGFGFRSRVLALVITMAGSAVFPAMWMLIVAFGGEFEYFVTSYFGNALAYQAAGLPDVTAWQLLGQLISRSPDATMYAVGWVVFVLISAAALLAPSQVRLMKREVVFLASSFLLLVLAMAAVVATQRDYGHYLIILPFFVALFPCGLAGLLVQRARRVRSTPRDAVHYEIVLAGLIVLLMILPVAGLRIEKPNPWTGSVRSWAEKASQPHSPIGHAIANLGQNSNRRLAVWGYAPEYHVETGFRQATRLSTSSSIFNDNSLRGFFLETYLADLNKNSPDVFVDAVAAGSFFMNDPATQSHEQVPEVAAYIANHYTLAREIRGIRIYRRNTDQ